jgi:glucose/arabinose dehydrogenase/mono/diheme cytochrome c family protein
MSTTAVLILLAGAAAAQQGDKKGEPQPPLPPTIKIPPSPVVPAAEALKTFKVAPGFRLELVASEPLVEDPVAMAFDPDGRMWVVEMRGYMPDLEGRGENAPVGRVVVLEDTDGDGKADRNTVFLDRLVLPRAIALVEGGVFVAEPPHLWLCRDRDGDLVCDEKSIVAPYGGRGNPEHMANGLLRAIDNWVYSANTGARFRREGAQWVQGTTRSRGQWGLTQDDEGRLFYNTNPEFLRGDLVPCYSPQAYVPRSPLLNVQIVTDQSVWPARVNPGVNRGYLKGFLREDGTLAQTASACGPCLYRGDAYPEEFRGNAFACDPSANVVKRIVLRAEGGTISGRNAYDRAEFIASTDERFRPVNLYTGPDGCLYVLDFYRGIIQHRAYMTSFLRNQILERGLDKPVGLGRIYRVVHESRPPGPAPRLSKASAAELVRHLAHPNGWWRDTAQRLLVERADAAAVPELRRLVASPAGAIARLHALWTLEGLRQLDAATLAAASADPDPRLRVAAQAIREGSDPMGALAVAAAGNPALPDAAFAGKELDFLERLMATEEWEREQPGRAALLERVAARVVASGKPGDVAELLALTASQSTAARWRQRALLEGASRAKPAAPLPLPERPAALVKLTFAADPEVRRRARDLNAWMVWPGKAEREPEPPAAAPLSAEEQARWERGRRQYAASCAACHQISGLGEEVKGPPLVDSPWVVGSEQRLVRILLQGLQGPITVNARRYSFNQEMPAVTNMSNDEIAEVLTYVRREWGHQAPPVDAATVRAVRAATEDREEPWTEKELLTIP